ncbi:MAG: serine--tRNA ligase [Candidatus Peribacteraceae bacterium]|jgi:seryl-tRNA synthetase|nr:serine--tRNA ligase [Candidatus Peribacteraceae bacterium]|tara:strand:+ start:742 stop:2040 length:1299 start_codon:yes stop_codon:yes gene_type:complete
MIDLDAIRANPKVYEKAVKDKFLDVSVKDFLKLDEDRKSKLVKVEEMRAKKNEVSKKIPTLKGAEKEKKLAEMKTFSDDLKTEEAALNSIEENWKAMQLDLPQIPLDSVPVGKDDESNEEVKKVGKIPKFKFTPKDHVILGEELDILDIPRGVKMAGARSYVLKGDGARLEMALLQFSLDKLREKGWTQFTPPYMATYDCFMGTGFFPGVDQENIYALGGQTEKDGPIESDNLYMVGTSEVTVASYHSGEVLKEKDLPLRYAGYSPCFRREAGTYGKDTKGLYRIHQFQKIEQVVLCEANQKEGLKMFNEILSNAEDVMQALELPYRIVTNSTGDMGKGKIFMQDIETWMPSRDSYGETHSCSYLGDYQARRLNIKYEDAGGNKKFAHTLNSTCIATPRILIPILEIYQNEDGTISVPKVLQPYMGKQKKIG